MFNPSKDLTEIQKILINDSEILELMGLTKATSVEKAKNNKAKQIQRFSNK